MKIKVLLAVLLLVTSPAWAEPDYQALASAIRLAEGNSNYGILTHYKHTSYKQACINTCKHSYQRWLKYRQIAPNSKIQYLEWLSKTYCPIGAKNDPSNLNKNWLTNVTYYYRGGV